MRLFFAMFAAYLIGSVPTGYLMARSKKNIDLRQHGSGNVGATNVLRSVGKLAAALTLLIDILKGFIAVTLLARVFYGDGMGINYPEYLSVMGLCTVGGHNWSIFLDFKGGKGVATSAGVLLALCPLLLLVGLCVWIFVFLISRIVSLSSLAGALAIPVAAYLFKYTEAIKFLVLFLAAMSIFSHRKNIARLLKKEEKKLSVKI